MLINVEQKSIDLLNNNVDLGGCCRFSEDDNLIRYVVGTQDETHQVRIMIERNLMTGEESQLLTFATEGDRLSLSLDEYGERVLASETFVTAIESASGTSYRNSWTVRRLDIDGSNELLM